eukprot:gene13861-biopygen2030
MEWNGDGVQRTAGRCSRVPFAPTTDERARCAKGGVRRIAGETARVHPACTAVSPCTRLERRNVTTPRIWVRPGPNVPTVG